MRLTIILVLFACEATADLSNFLNIGSSTQIIATVTSIIDGDTIEVEIGTKATIVRLLGIDAPELPNEPFSSKATAFAKAELLNQSVKLIYSLNTNQQWDKYGRLLAVVVKDDEIFNIELLKSGLSRRMFIYNDIIKFPAWEDMEIIARKQFLNIWSRVNSYGIFINEINPNPFPEEDNEAEFVELYNNTSKSVDMGSWTFVSIYNKVVIHPSVSIPPYGYLLITRTNPLRFKEIYPKTPEETIIINGGTNLILRNSHNPKEDLIVHLIAKDGYYQDSLVYNLDWDNKSANGTGKTLERKSLFITNLCDSEVGGADDNNYDASLEEKGSPGTINSVSSITTRAIIDLQKIVDKTSVDTGDIITYTIYYSNKGNKDATNAKIYDYFPKGTRHYSHTEAKDAPYPAYYDKYGIIWYLPILRPFIDTGSVTLKLKVGK